MDSNFLPTFLLPFSIPPFPPPPFPPPPQIKFNTWFKYFCVWCWDQAQDSKISFLIMGMYVYLCANIMCASGCIWPQRPDVLAVSGAGIIGGCELPNVAQLGRCGEQHLGPRETQNAHLTVADLPLQSQPLIFIVEFNI